MKLFAMKNYYFVITGCFMLLLNSCEKVEQNTKEKPVVTEENVITDEGVSTTVEDILQPPTNGLVAYYPFNGNADDMSENNNNGNVKGALLTEDRKGNENSAYKFRGYSSSDCIVVSNHETLKFDKELTISVWFKTESYEGVDGNNINNTIIGGMQTLISKDGDRSGFDIIVRLKENNFFWTNFRNVPYDKNNAFSIGYEYDNSKNDNEIKDENVYLNNWNHIVYVVDNDVIKLFLNGKLLVSKDEAVVNFDKANKSDLIFGRYGQNGGLSPFRWFPYTGDLDDIRIYNRALTEAEIISLSKE